MSVRSLAAGDGPAVRRLWDDLGGWHRNTSPTSDVDVDRTIERLLHRRASLGLRRRSPMAEESWVTGPQASPGGWLYARSDAEQNYVIPLVPPDDAGGALEGLLASAKEWFLRRGANRFVLDVPQDRADLRTEAQQAGRVLWHRSVFDRDLTPLPTSTQSATTVRDFRRADLAVVQALFARRHPEGPPPPVPVAFLELRGGWFRDPAWELDRAVWVAEDRGQVLAVAGATHRPKSSIAFLGPWVLSERATPFLTNELINAVTTWAARAGGQRLRTTLPTAPSEDALALEAAGFAKLAESDLYELKA